MKEIAKSGASDDNQFDANRGKMIDSLNNLKNIAEKSLETHSASQR